MDERRETVLQPPFDCLLVPINESYTAWSSIPQTKTHGSFVISRRPMTNSVPSFPTTAGNTPRATFSPSIIIPRARKNWNPLPEHRRNDGGRNRADYTQTRLPSPGAMEPRASQSWFRNLPASAMRTAPMRAGNGEGFQHRSFSERLMGL